MFVISLQQIICKHLQERENLPVFVEKAFKKIVLYSEINYNRNKLGLETSFASEWKNWKRYRQSKTYIKNKESRNWNKLLNSGVVLYLVFEL